MLDRKSLSFTLAARLRSLRMSRGLSHEALAQALTSSYGIHISMQTCMSLELTAESNPRISAGKFPNLGTRVEYLYILADFFDVSMDYLLGRSDASSVDASIQSAVSATGLSEKAVNSLKDLSESVSDKEMLNQWFCDQTFHKITLTVVQGMYGTKKVYERSEKLYLSDECVQNSYMGVMQCQMVCLADLSSYFSGLLRGCEDNIQQYRSNLLQEIQSRTLIPPATTWNNVVIDGD